MAEDAKYWWTLQFRGGKHGEAEPFDDVKEYVPQEEQRHMSNLAQDWPGMNHEVWSFFEREMVEAVVAKLKELNIAGVELKKAKPGK